MKNFKHAAGYAGLWIVVAALADIVLVPLDMLMQHEPFLIRWLSGLASSPQPFAHLVGITLLCWGSLTLVLLGFFAIQKKRLKN